jgi:tetratricopeptide (TPR) repeat protein
MLTKKKKLSRKEIKQDKFVEIYYKVYGFVQDNSQRVILYGVLLIVVIFAAIFYVNNRKQKNETAGVELARIMNLFDAGNYQEAIDGQPGTTIIGLKKIVDDYGSTPNGETAKMFLADSYNLLGKTDEAYKYYKDYDGSIELYQSAALAGQAGYFASKNNYSEAAELYEKAAHVTDTDVMNSEYLLKAGINYMKEGKNKEAKKAFETVQNDYKTSASAREVERYLVQLN